MFYTSLLQGLIVGISIAAPIGPIGVLCIRRTLSHGKWLGFVSGLGIATAHAIYGLLSVFGLSIISHFLAGKHMWLHLFGGVYLCFLGFRMCIRQALQSDNTYSTGSLFQSYLSSLLITLTNPVTFLSFTTMFTGIGMMQHASNHLANCFIVSGVFLSSAGWWFVLSSLIGLCRQRLKPQMILWLNRLSGILIFFFGLMYCFHF